MAFLLSSSSAIVSQERRNSKKKVGFLSLLLEKASPSVRIFLCSLFAAAARNITLALPLPHLSLFTLFITAGQKELEKPLRNVLKRTKKVLLFFVLPCKAERSVEKHFMNHNTKCLFNLSLPHSLFPS